MVAEFWPGWFDNWGDGHHKMDLEKTTIRVSNILKAGASINLYMFHGIGILKILKIFTLSACKKYYSRDMWDFFVTLLPMIERLSIECRNLFAFSLISLNYNFFGLVRKTSKHFLNKFLCKTKTKCLFLARVFQRLTPVICICFEFWLVR